MYFLPPKLRNACMLSCPSDLYKYYLPKVYVVTYLNDVYLLEPAIPRVWSSRIYEISLVDPNSSIIMLISKSRQKTDKRRLNKQNETHMRLHTSGKAFHVQFHAWRFFVDLGYSLSHWIEVRLLFLLGSKVNELHTQAFDRIQVQGSGEPTCLSQLVAEQFSPLSICHLSY